jgi:hypothetical protein
MEIWVDQVRKADRRAGTQRDTLTDGQTDREIRSIDTVGI